MKSNRKKSIGTTQQFDFLTNAIGAINNKQQTRMNVIKYLLYYIGGTVDGLPGIGATLSN